MTDVVFVSSIFGQVKIAEPMGACILAARLRERGRDVLLLEPSVEGWSVAEAAERVAAVAAPIVAISMLRDKNVDDVLAFVRDLRRRRPDAFIVMGGHGPSLSLSRVPDRVDVASYLARAEGSATTDAGACSSTGFGSTAPVPLVLGAVVHEAVSGRGLGAAEVCSTGLSRGVAPAPPTRRTVYFDVTPQYLDILGYVDAAMLGESDDTFPELVDRVLAGRPWRDVPAVAYRDGDVYRRMPLPPKIRDLDALPFMARDVLVDYQKRYSPDVPASILASRGCFYRCTFCSVVSYERLQEGSAHRRRSATNLVAEMRALHERYGVRRFNFEDDNFIVNNKAGRERIHELCDRIRELPFPVEFTFFCRADVVREELFADLKDAGLVGIYFGLESVYPGDLDFFHKGLSVPQMFDALDTLGALGYTPTVDAELRIMLGYITWHPLSSFESLRATSAFLKRYAAPPKLLRRKLRLYGGTQVVDDVRRLDLLDPDHPDGWRFRDTRLQGLEARVNELFGAVNKVRDRLRTLEKAGTAHGYDIDVHAFRGHRLHLDAFLIAEFDTLVDVAERAGGADSPEVREAVRSAHTRFEAYRADVNLAEAVEAGYRACGFDEAAVDLFRK